MLMVIFGAGASYDSAQAFRLVNPTGGSYVSGAGASPPVPFRQTGGPWRPPLANDLFRDPDQQFGHIILGYPRLGHILPYLREPSNGRSVEEVLESLQAEADGYAERQREFASVRFYLRDLLFEVSNRWRDITSGVTNYGPLIGEILRHNKQNQPICLVTFNYDLLLDRAVESFDYHAQEPENQFKAPQILNLFKPHGSVDWARRLAVHADNWVHREHLVDNVGTITLTNEYVWSSFLQKTGEFVGPDGKPAFPAISIPFQNKTDSHFECPPSHLARLCELLPDVRKILIIGWQAREAHFLNLLRSNLRGVTHLMVVGRDSADSDRVLQYFVREIAKTMHPNFQSYKGQGGFTNFVVNREGETFFGSKGIGAQASF